MAYFFSFHPPRPFLQSQLFYLLVLQYLSIENTTTYFRSTFILGLTLFSTKADSHTLQGLPAFNQHEQSDFNTVFRQLPTIQPGYIDGFKYTCPCSINTGVFVYMVQNDPQYQKPSISFCPTYFTLPTLGNKIKQWAGKNNSPFGYAGLNKQKAGHGSAVPCSSGNTVMLTLDRLSFYALARYIQNHRGNICCSPVCTADCQI